LLNSSSAPILILKCVHFFSVDFHGFPAGSNFLQYLSKMPLKNYHPLSGTYGLVVCGGNSSRMGSDKSMLIYYEKPQRYHVYQMLQPFCEKVFISCNEKQATAIEDGYNILADDPSFKNIMLF
jgi:hypothetical protein